MSGRIAIARGAVAGLIFLAALTQLAQADEPPTFFRAINLGGRAGVIDGNPWDADDAPDVVSSGAIFEDQAVRLSPPTDGERARMIRSSRWSPQGNARVAITGVPAGTYSVYLYVWEDNHSQSFDIRLNGELVAQGVKSGNAGQWRRLGPWVIDAVGGKLEVAAEGGTANLSGLEVWRGKLSAEDRPLNDNVAAPTREPLETQVAKLLARNCMECHNASDRKGGLDLSRRDRALAGGDSGSVLAPGQPEESALLNRATAGEMPPESRPKLTESEQKLLRTWIAAGARWAADPIDPFLYTSDRRAGYNWWSLQPIADVQPPEVHDGAWPRNPVDHFVLRGLEDAGLSPAPEADRSALIRRLYFDLVGLPPTPEEVEAFVNDSDPRAYERLVDRLLDSPHFGERWARHWLDIVRYGESQGFERNKFRENAWKYRDFVVEAFNSDMPYDQFIRWQIAGDVLEPDDPLAVIASGFLALGPYDLTAYNNGTADMRAFAREEELEGLVATVGQTFLGLTINCARCHDHKFDPITQKEFYRFSAALGGIFQGDERESLSNAGRQLAQERIAALRRQLDELAQHEKSAPELAKHDLKAKASRLENAMRLLSGGPVHTTRPQQPGAWRILARGDYRQPGDVVSPGGIAAVSNVSPEWGLAEDASEDERRKALAGWLADAKNPLTPRVIVNRLWGHHFGQPLVRTPSDFGFQGGTASHPELLDWLAGQLIHPDDGPAWRLKPVHRLIVNSAAYRQSNRSDKRAMEIDAENRLLWRRTPQRLEAEIFRDAVLAVSGEIDLRVGGPGFRDFKVSSAGNNETYTVFEAVGSEFNRRSLYRTWVRTGTSPLLDALDCPDPSVATPRRSVTSTPLQALSLLNSKFMEHYAQKFAERVERETPSDSAAQARRAFTLAFSRGATQDEAEFGERLIGQIGLTQFCLVLLNANEFSYVD